MGQRYVVADLGSFVVGAQPSDLALEIRSLRDVAAALVDETVPDIDVGDPCPLRALAE